MAKRVERAERILERIEQRTGMTEAGKKWLIAALDPMHDEKIECQGYPDRCQNASIVQVIKQTATVTVPGSYGATDKWGFHIYMDEFINNGQAAKSVKFLASNNNLHIDTTTMDPVTLHPYGGLNVVAFNETVPSGMGFSEIPLSGGANSNKNSLQMEVSSQFELGKSRVLSQGFEVINTTPELFIGGSTLVYENPSSRQDSVAMEVVATYAALDSAIEKYGRDNIFVEEEHEEVNFGGDSGSESSECVLLIHKLDEPVPKPKEPKSNTIKVPKRYFVIDRMTGKRNYLALLPVTRSSANSFTYQNLTPQTLAEAQILPGTKQWDAKQGCYLVQMMNDMTNVPSFPTCESALWVVDELSFPTPTAVTRGNPFMELPSATPENQLAFPGNKRIPYNPKGAVFSGLSHESTFTINYTSIIERIVSSQDPTLAVLATPSPEEDPVAIQLYLQVISKLPIGVVFKDNGLGEWFLGVVDSIAETVTSVARPVLGAISGWQQGRTNTADSGGYISNAGNMATPKAQAKKNPGKARVKKTSEVKVFQGPRMQGGNFTTKNSKNAKKNARKKKKKAVAAVAMP